MDPQHGETYSPKSTPFYRGWERSRERRSKKKSALQRRTAFEAVARAAHQAAEAGAKRADNDRNKAFAELRDRTDTKIEDLKRQAAEYRKKQQEKTEKAQSSWFPFNSQDSQ